MASLSLLLICLFFVGISGTRTVLHQPDGSVFTVDEETNTYGETTFKTAIGGFPIFLKQQDNSVKLLQTTSVLVVIYFF